MVFKNFWANAVRESSYLIFYSCSLFLPMNTCIVHQSASFLQYPLSHCGGGEQLPSFFQRQVFISHPCMWSYNFLKDSRFRNRTIYTNHTECATQKDKSIWTLLSLPGSECPRSCTISSMCSSYPFPCFPKLRETLEHRKEEFLQRDFWFI